MHKQKSYEDRDPKGWCGDPPAGFVRPFHAERYGYIFDSEGNMAASFDDNHDNPHFEARGAGRIGYAENSEEVWKAWRTWLAPMLEDLTSELDVDLLVSRMNTPNWRPPHELA